jgi:hypothetical protein
MSNLYLGLNEFSMKLVATTTMTRDLCCAWAFLLLTTVLSLGAQGILRNQFKDYLCDLHVSLDYLISQAELSLTGFDIGGSGLSLTGFDNDLLVSKTSNPYFALEGSYEGFQMRLGSQPAALVVVNVSSPDGKTILDPQILSFNESNWNIPQDIRLISNRDYLLLDSPYDSQLDITMHSLDMSYNFNTTSYSQFVYLVVNSDIGMCFVMC